MTCMCQDLKSATHGSYNRSHSQNALLVVNTAKQDDMSNVDM